jgi:hypothetical protein
MTQMAKTPDLKLQRSTLTECGGTVHAEMIYAAKAENDYGAAFPAVIVRLPVAKNGNPRLRDAELDALTCAHKLIQSEIQRLHKDGGR